MTASPRRISTVEPVAAPISTKPSRSASGRVLKNPPRLALRRHPNSCEGANPAWRAIADTFAPGCSVSSISRALASADQRRRGRCGLASRGLATASRTWKLLSLLIGADIEIDTDSLHICQYNLAYSITPRQMGSASRLRFNIGTILFSLGTEVRRSRRLV